MGASEGMFPLSYVRIDVPLEPKCEPTRSNRAMALYAFAAETDQDLSLKVKSPLNGGSISFFIW
jgi:hypothetical protein